MNARNLSVEKMESIDAGWGKSWKNWVDGGCALFGVATLYTSGAIILNPVGGAVAGACAGWGVARAFELI